MSSSPSNEASIRTDPASGGKNEPHLKRAIGPGLLLLFIVGDMLGTGIYALTGQVAKEVGGAAWLPFMVAFAVAYVTARSYLELVTKYPQAAGAALYVHKAFGIHFLTFIVCFTVMASGVTSASAAARSFAANFVKGFHLDLGPTGVMLVALCFMIVLMIINLRGVSESVKVNVMLTVIELSGLLLVIGASIYFMTGGEADFSRAIAFETPEDKNTFLALSTATSLAFFAMVGFEDSVNMAEETKNPSKIFPKIMLTGLGIGVVTYTIVSICAVAVVPVAELASTETPLTTVVKTALPDFPIDQVFPFIAMVAVANGALLNMLMASRLLYGMSKQAVLPPFLGRVLPKRQTPWAGIVVTTGIALVLITVLSLDDRGSIISLLGGTTSLLLTGVFTIVNIAVLVLRRDRTDRPHYSAGKITPVIGIVACTYLTLPWSSGRPIAQYEIAGILLLLGVVLWAITYVINRVVWAKKTELRDPSQLG